jgi:hypothetical protein
MYTGIEVIDVYVMEVIDVYVMEIIDVYGDRGY